ncbi:MAG: hydantoinase/oxoprolinase family protein [Planctomycetota bacterium]|jgi:N-methylhydantoinase A
MNYRIGIDVGGTFTDLFMWASDGRVDTCKALSTPKDPSVAVVSALEMMAEKENLTLNEFATKVTNIVHGTTVTTNAVLTQTGARTGLLTTEGVRDALEMRRGIREDQYDNRLENVVPLVPRYLRRPVSGRLDYSGKELTELNRDDVRDAVALLKTNDVSAVAICFMHSYANPEHEAGAAEIVRELMPEAYLSVSSEVLPTVRFFNRISTTVMNSYVGPILKAYLDRLTGRLSEIGFSGVLLIMQSNGGVALPEVMAARPAATLLSGPAGGPGAASTYAKPHNNDDCIVVDMGGTSFDASLVQGGEAATYNESEIDRMRIALPMLAITTIGAGGGSIGWIDDGGLLRMGPQSAGAMPGPACYDIGGELPTCTDANVVLGYLDPNTFAGGRMKLQADKANVAITKHIAEPLNMSAENAAAGMYRVINTNMAHGTREITLKRGYDPREFLMVVAGGAGSLHACAIANELEIPRLIIPPTASVLCATGMLLTDLQHDYVRSYVSNFSDLKFGRLKTLIDEMVVEGRGELRKEGISEDRAEVQIALDLRYVKQYHEVTVAVPTDVIDSGDFEAIGTVFHTEHNRVYGYDLSTEGTELELINVRVKAIGRTEKPTLPKLENTGAEASPALRGTRRAYVPEADEFKDINVYDGHALRAGNVIQGPALIERTDTTILVSAAYTATMDELGSCVLQNNGANND